MQQGIRERQGMMLREAWVRQDICKYILDDEHDNNEWTQLFNVETGN